jgi:hypothetical protein
MKWSGVRSSEERKTGRYLMEQRMLIETKTLMTQKKATNISRNIIQKQTKRIHDNNICIKEFLPSKCNFSAANIPALRINLVCFSHPESSSLE